MKRLLPVIMCAVFLSCSAKKDPSTPKGAFALLAPCMDKEDTACLYRHLDRESRWALQTIYKTLTEMRGIVNQSYPQNRKAEAFGSWKKEAHAQSPTELFRIFCVQRNCLKSILDGFGAVKNVTQIDSTRVLVDTVRGAQFEMAQYDNRFGLSIFQKELLAAKIRFIDSLKQVKKNAKAFAEQRAASEPAN